MKEENKHPAELNPPDASFLFEGYSFGYPSGTPGLPMRL